MTPISPILRLKGINKSFSSVPALLDLNFDVFPGEVHALLGENGAGKSTLIKIMSGIYQPDSGEILLDGSPIHLISPHEAQQAGISVVPQELNMQNHMSVAENVFLGRQPRGRFGLIDYTELHRQTHALLTSLNMNIAPTAIVGDLAVAQRQLISIARAISVDARIIILDEPTASLSQRETELLVAILQRLKERGVAIVYISHRLDELEGLADRITILRDGRHIDTRPASAASLDQIVSMMVGRDISDLYRKQTAAIGEPVLQVRGLTRPGVLDDISFTLHAGEILGLAGLVGAGRTEVARAIFGADPISGGDVLIDSKPIHVSSPSEAIGNGIGLAPEERKQQGLVIDLSVSDNIALPSFPHLFPFGWVRPRRQTRLVNEYVQRLDIRAASINMPVKYLSGGNQQRVVLSKWLATRPRVLILDEPTRGVDVGAKAEIHELMSQLAQQGVAILMISSDMPELLAMSDRVLVMYRGRITGEFDRATVTQESIMLCATGERGYVR